MPLAIELAAARSGVLTPAEIAAGLDDCLRMLSGGPRRSLERHQTLAACLSWSHDLLGDAERALLRRLAVFAGGFDLDAAQAVGDVEAGVALDLVASLVDKSCVVVEEHDGRASRYRLLEPVRQFAEARLVEAGEEEAARDRHVAHYTRLMRQAQPHLESGDLEWLARVDAEYDNICAALTRVTTGSDEWAKVRLVAPLVFYWPMRSLHHDGMRWLEEALPATIDHPAARLTLLLGSAVLANQLTEQELARERASEALELAESLGDARGIAWALQVVALVGRSDLGHATGGRVSFHSTEDRHLFERVLEYGTDVTGPTVFYWAVAMLAWHLAQEGELASARHLVAGHLEGCRKEAGPPRLAHMLLELGEIDMALGNLGGAVDPLAEAAVVAHQVGQPEMEMAILAAQAKLATARGEWAKGLELVEAGGAVSGLRDVLGMSVDADYQRALILRHMGRVEDARAVLAVCIDALPRERVPLWTSEHDVLLGDLLRLNGEVASARAAVESAIELQRSYGWRLVTAQGTVVLARVARDEGHLLEAYALAHEALDVFAEAGAMLDLIASLEVLAGVVGALDRPAEAVRLFAAGHEARERIGYVRSVVEQPSYEADVAVLRGTLGAAAFDEAWHEGALLSIEEAVAYARRGRGERRRPAAGWDSLTPTETEVVRLVAEGLSNPEIAERMFVSRATVRTHLSHVFAKLGVSSRAELAAQAACRRD